MNMPCTWEILFTSLWIQVGFVPGIQCKDGAVGHLSKEDVLLLKDEPNPKCFTRTGEDFTCFFETADNGIYDLFYRVISKKRCETSVQRTEDGTFNHICSFPSSELYFYVETHLEVVQRNNNTSLYKRVISVEDHFLLDPPFRVSLDQNGRAGQLQVAWQLSIPKYWADHVMYRIRYSSKGLGVKIKEAKELDILDYLVPGEEVEVQVSAKCAPNKSTGHWSSWSQPVQAVVPQSSDDISLICFTPDLQNVTCQWNGSRYGSENEYKLFYRMSLGEAPGWSNWAQCRAGGISTDLCRFRGDQSRKVRVKLSGTPARLGRTFYTEEFTLNKNVKTFPPSHLRGSLENASLHLTWEAPIRSLSVHLQYEVGYQIRKGGAWMTVLVKGPETATYLEVPTGSQYFVKCRAKPTGSIYSGYWSDWSDVLIGDTPIYRDTLLMLCILASMLITAVILIFLFPTYLRKLKLFFWPPVPNLDKVLQGFLTEMNGQRWNPPLTAKQCPEETTSSVVEIMFEDEVSELGKPSEEATQLPTPDTSFSSIDQLDGSPGTEVFPDYVTLNKDNVILCPKGNNYVEEQVGEKEGPAMKDEIFQTCHSLCTDGSDCTPTGEGSNFLNHAYLPLGEPADRFDCKVTAARVPGNLYTNLPCS